MPGPLKRHFLPLGLSLLLHYTVGVTLALLLGVGPGEGFTALIVPKNTVIRLKEVPSPRTVGRESGAQEFSMPLPPPSPQFGLESLQFPRDIQVQEGRERDGAEDGPRWRGLGRTRSQRSEALRRLGVAPDDARALSFTDLDIQFIPPRGVSEDELNSVEKKFYSFQRRVFLAYVSHFVRAYRRLVGERPLLREVLEEESHSLLGRVRYQAQGDILSLEVVRDSPREDVRRLLEETLRGMDRVPNPRPKFWRRTTPLPSTTGWRLTDLLRDLLT